MWSGKVGQRARHPEEADLAFVTKGLHGFDSAVSLQLLAARRHVNLEQVEAVGTEAAQALLDPRPDVVGPEVVGERRGGAGRRVAEEAPAFGGQEVLVAPVPDVTADQLLAAAVVDRGVDQVDPPNREPR